MMQGADVNAPVQDADCSGSIGGRDASVQEVVHPGATPLEVRIAQSIFQRFELNEDSSITNARSSMNRPRRLTLRCRR